MSRCDYFICTVQSQDETKIDSIYFLYKYFLMSLYFPDFIMNDSSVHVIPKKTLQMNFHKN